MRLLLISVLATLVSFAPAYGRTPRARHERPGESHHARAVQRVQYGMASWYGRKFQGRTMSCGAPFNEHELVAAHRTLPLGTKVRVTNLRNGRSVVVKVRDRGPYIRSRIIDLSHAAARRLGFTHRGIAPVVIQVVSLPVRHGPRVSG